MLRCWPGPASGRIIILHLHRYACTCRIIRCGAWVQDMLMHLKAGDAEAADKLVECAVAAVDSSLPEEVEEEVRLANL